MKTLVSLCFVLSRMSLGGTGALEVSVTAAGTLAPVPGAFVVLEGTSLGGITDARGSCLIDGVPPGAYVLRVSSVGFHPRGVTDVIVGSRRTTPVDVSLSYSVVEGGVIHVTPDYFPDESSGPVGKTEFSGEQIRRAPGSAGDVSRVITALPSVTGIDDQYNGMAVRGGNPMENGIYLDGMEIPNINHFPRQGTSGGGLGMVNTDLISDVKFSAGGFSPAFGDRLSSVMEIGIREGSRRGFEGQANLSMAGFGTVLEGPIHGGAGSWLVCGRRSYVDLLVDIADIDAVPVYSDLHGKLVYDLNPAHRLFLFGLGAWDYVDYGYEQAFEDGNGNYGITRGRNTSLGAGWRWIWPGDGFSSTILSWNGIHYGGDYYDTLTRRWEAVQNSTENSVSLRNDNSWRPREGLTLRFGLEGRLNLDDFENSYAADTNYSGDPIPELHVRRSTSGLRGGIFASAGITVIPGVTVTGGSRVDFSETTGKTRVSPRGSVCWEPAPGTTLSAAGGVYRQDLPRELTSRGPEFENLDTPVSLHLVLGFAQLLAPDTRLQFEAYSKRGSGFPYDPMQPGYFVLDGVSAEQDLHSFETLNSGGETRAEGVEITLRKQLVSGLYGLAAGSLYSSEYRTPGEPWRRRIYDQRWTGTLEGGYRFDSGWEVSCRWLLAGGRPYTPLDPVASEAHNRTILDSTRINAERYPHYSSLNLRADRRFSFERGGLVCYASVWNILNRRNVTATFWNRIEKKEDHIYQWAVMPVVGIEYEF